MFTVWPVGIKTVSFQTRFGSMIPSRAEDEEAAAAVNVEGMVHRMVGVDLVDEPDLHPVPDPEPPVDGRTLSSAVTVNQLPARVGGGGHAVHRSHVVFPLDAGDFLVRVFSMVTLRLRLCAVTVSGSCSP